MTSVRWVAAACTNGPVDYDAQRGRFAAFVDEHVVPRAAWMHREEHTPEDLVRRLGHEGLLGLNVPVEHGGAGADDLTLGLLAESLGRGCSSVRSLLTVHSMVCHVLTCWGTPAQRDRWLPLLAAGEFVAAFALSEPDVGSDACSVATRVRHERDEVVLTGVKAWTTYGTRADVLLVIGCAEDGPVAVLVERNRPGVRVTPIPGLVGIRASMTAEVVLDEVRVPADQVLGRWGRGVLQVAGTALDLGRFTVAWGCVGLVEAAVRASAAYSRERTQFGVPIVEHQLVRRMLTDMATDHRTARLLCLDAARRRIAGDPTAPEVTSMAKYHAARVATRVTADAVQLHGANGCSADYSLQRLHGDAAVMEVIEGSTQLHQVRLADFAVREYATTRRTSG